MRLRYLAALLLLAGAARAADYKPPTTFTVSATGLHLRANSACVRVVVTGDQKEPWRCAQPAPAVDRHALWLLSPTEDRRLIVTMRIPGEPWALEAVIKTAPDGGVASSFIAHVFRYAREGCAAKNADALSSYELMAKGCAVEKKALPGGGLDTHERGVLVDGQVGVELWNLPTPSPVWGLVNISARMPAGQVKTAGSTERPGLRGDALKAPVDAMKAPPPVMKAPEAPAKSPADAAKASADAMKAPPGSSKAR